MRGEFVRGWDNGRGVDVGRSMASSQVATQVGQGGYWATTVDNAEAWVYVAQTAFSFSGPYATYTPFGQVRPRNVALLACMKQ